MSYFHNDTAVNSSFMKKIEECRSCYKELETKLLEIIDTSAGRELALALTKLQESSFFANRAIFLNSKAAE